MFLAYQWDEEKLFTHLSLFGRVGFGTLLYQGCQDIVGPFPSVFLDKWRKYRCGSFHNQTFPKIIAHPMIKRLMAMMCFND
jgi:hypothetical protein